MPTAQTLPPRSMTTSGTVHILRVSSSSVCLGVPQSRSSPGTVRTWRLPGSHIPRIVRHLHKMSKPQILPTTRIQFRLNCRMRASCLQTRQSGAIHLYPVSHHSIRPTEPILRAPARLRPSLYLRPRSVSSFEKPAYLLAHRETSSICLRCSRRLIPPCRTMASDTRRPWTAPISQPRIWPGPSRPHTNTSDPSYPCRVRQSSKTCSHPPLPKTLTQLRQYQQRTT